MVLQCVVKKFFIFCDASGHCIVNQETSEETNTFTDVLEAIAHLHATEAKGTVQVTVYDPLGKVAFTKVL
jgi:hypothetical protein